MNQKLNKMIMNKIQKLLKKWNGIIIYLVMNLQNKIMNYNKQLKKTIKSNNNNIKNNRNSKNNKNIKNSNNNKNNNRISLIIIY